jgi:topoisomerase IA-like protein
MTQVKTDFGVFDVEANGTIHQIKPFPKSLKSIAGKTASEVADIICSSIAPAPKKAATKKPATKKAVATKTPAKKTVAKKTTATKKAK